MEIKTPSGLHGRIRKMKLREARILEQGGPTAQDQVLTNIWEETFDPGPYEIPEGEKGPKWAKALTGDRFVTLIHVRSATFGPEFSFKVNCPECENRFEWTVNLPDLPVKDYGEDALDAYKAGTPLTVAFGDQTVEYALATAEAEKRAAALKKKGNVSQYEVAVLSRVSAVTGQKNLKKWALDLDMDEAIRLIREMDKAEGGIETTIEVECTRCLADIRVNLPFAQPGFWTPKQDS